MYESSVIGSSSLKLDIVGPASLTVEAVFSATPRVSSVGLYHCSTRSAKPVDVLLTVSREKGS